MLEICCSTLVVRFDCRLYSQDNLHKLVQILFVSETGWTTNKGPNKPWCGLRRTKCPVRKGAGSQSVVSCVTTISYREATASGLYRGLSEAAQACMCCVSTAHIRAACSCSCTRHLNKVIRSNSITVLLQYVYLGYLVPWPWCTTRVWVFWGVDLWYCTRQKTPENHSLFCTFKLEGRQSTCWHWYFVFPFWVDPGLGRPRLYRKIGKSKNRNSVFSIKDMHCRGVLTYL